MEEYGEEGMAVAAARILLSLRSRNLVRWPEWIPRPEEEPVETDAELPPALPEAWPKRPRLGVRARAEGSAWLLSWQSSSARLGRSVLAGSGACSGGEEKRAWPPLLIKVKREPLTAQRPEMPPHHGEPSTSGADGARSRSRRRPHVGETVTARTTESPDTPLDYANAAGSGASSNGDDVARSSGDEGCGGSPAKRTRADVAVAAGADPAVVKVQEREMKDKEDYRDEKGHLIFDLNEDFNMDMGFC